MKLPVPGPRDLFAVLDKAEALLAMGPRLVALLDTAERELGRVGPLLDRVEAVATGAATEVTRVAGICDQVEGTIDRTNLVVDQAGHLVGRVTPMLDRLEPPLTKLQPTLEVLAETTDPAEVAALVALVDHLPELTRMLEEDVLPVMGTLGTVAPDLRDLLATSSELNEIIGKLPGFGRIKRRVEEEQAEDDEDQAPDAATA